MHSRWRAERQLFDPPRARGAPPEHCELLAGALWWLGRRSGSDPLNLTSIREDEPTPQNLLDVRHRQPSGGNVSLTLAAKLAGGGLLVATGAGCCPVPSQRAALLHVNTSRSFETKQNQCY